MKVSHVLGCVVAIILLILGVFIPIPQKHIYIDNGLGNSDKWGSEYANEYVGGDAYNLIIESSLKSGWTSGILSLKSVFIGAGIILLFATIYSDVHHKASIKKQELIIAEIKNQNIIIEELKKQNELLESDFIKNKEDIDYNDELPSL